MNFTKPISPQAIEVMKKEFDIMILYSLFLDRMAGVYKKTHILPNDLMEALVWIMDDPQRINEVSGFENVLKECEDIIKKATSNEMQNS